MTATEVYQTAIIAQLNGNKDHGWGKLDQLAVIMAIVKNFYSNPKNVGKELEGEAKDQVEAQVNGSAFRQILEKQNLLNEAKKGTKATKRSFNVFTVAAVEPAKK